MNPTEKLKRAGYEMPKKSDRKSPVWKGPEEDGVTQSLLTKFLVCRERFRLLVVEGLKPVEVFNHRIEYGNMWHVCEESLAQGGSSSNEWLVGLRTYAGGLCRRYPQSQEQIDHWYNVCKTQFPLYVEYWLRHPDVESRTPLLQEQVFDVGYRLPSGRKVRLRGKWDAVDLVGKSVWLFETKTKGDIREGQIRSQLRFDLQALLYLVALQASKDLGCWSGLLSAGKIVGVRYNVIRRPLSGGKGTIVRHKPTKSNPLGESKESYYSRLKEVIQSDASSYFMRWNVEVSEGDVLRFRRECLDPVLEQLCDWWEWVSFIMLREGNVWDNDVTFGARPDLETGGKHCSAIHWRTPFGISMGLLEGGSTDLDSFLEDGSEVGLRRVDNLFPELG